MSNWFRQHLFAIGDAFSQLRRAPGNYFFNILVQIANIYVLVIVVWAIFSWFDHSKGILDDIYRVLNTLVEPYVNIFRRFIPPLGGIDLSPLVAVIVLQVVIQVVYRVLLNVLL
jgi:YggT family protein